MYKYAIASLTRQDAHTSQECDGEMLDECYRFRSMSWHCLGHAVVRFDVDSVEVVDTAVVDKSRVHGLLHLAPATYMVCNKSERNSVVLRCFSLFGEGLFVRVAPLCCGVELAVHLWQGSPSEKLPMLLSKQSDAESDIVLSTYHRLSKLAFSRQFSLELFGVFLCFMEIGHDSTVVALQLVQ